MRETTPIRLRGLSLTPLLVLFVAASSFSHAQIAREDQVKAAYVYNFAKFVEWPARDFATATAPIRICVMNDHSFETELNQIVNGKTIAGRPVSIVGAQDADQCRRCQVLFVNSSQERQVRPIIQALRDSSVLTVGETTGFLDEGGIINFVTQDDRVQFAVNHRAADRAGLRISSRLLSVARLVIE
jgi:hypothetical protein